MLYPDFDELIRLGSRAARVKIAPLQKSAALAAGDTASPFRGQGLEFYEVRDYRAGDDVRNIDWRVTARTNRPHMKIFTEERERTVILCIDTNATMRFGTRGTFKSVQAARTAALLGWQACNNNDRVGGLLFGDVEGGLCSFAPTRSRTALWRTLKRLCDHHTGVHINPVPLGDALRHLERTAPTGALVFIMSDFMILPDDLENHFANIRRRCDVVLMAVSDQADRLIPALGPLRFSDESGRATTVDTDHKGGRDFYTKLWQETRNKLADAARRRKISIVDLSTDRDVIDDLARVFLTRKAGSLKYNGARP